MNILILAAGYATRLYPLTQNTAKPLLGVAGKPMIEWVMDNLAPIPDIANVYIVTNDKFAADFQHWADEYGSRQPKLHFKIINDGSTDDSNKLGAIGDIHLVVSRENLTCNHSPSWPATIYSASRSKVSPRQPGTTTPRSPPTM